MLLLLLDDDAPACIREEERCTRLLAVGDELEITFDSNFTPDVAKNHFHVWWGEIFSVEQVGRNGFKRKT